jgi:hypothetical protein
LQIVDDQQRGLERAKGPVRGLEHAHRLELFRFGRPEEKRL